MIGKFRPSRPDPSRRIAATTFFGLALALGACATATDRVAADSTANAESAGVALVGLEEASPFGSYLAGRFARSERDLGSAASFLLKALADDPDNHDLRSQAFAALVVSGRIDEAIGLANEIIAADPAAPLPGLTLALAALRAGDPAVARERLSMLSSTGYNAILVPLIEAWLTVADGDHAAALGILGSMSSGGGFQAFRSFHEALIQELAGDPAAAEAAYRVALGAQPGAFRVVQALGGLLERAGRIEDARAVYQDFASISPDTPWVDDGLARLEASGPPPPLLVANPVEGTAELLFGLANALQGEEDSESALGYARFAEYLRPDSDATALLLGDVFDIQGRAAEAIEAYGRVSPGSPLAWTARLRTAVNLDAVDRTAEAVAGLEAMAAERPTRPDPWITIGDIRRGREAWAESVAAYDLAVTLVPTPEPRHWRLFYARGIALERSDQWPRAEADFLRALELEPDQPYVLNYLGYSWVDKGLNLGRALDMIEGAVDQRPNDGFIVDSLGWAHYRLGDYREAVKHLERAVELQPDDATINDHLGDAFWQVGRYAEAEFQWRRALSLEPDQDLAAAIRAKLEHGLASAPALNGDG
ncbi:MAG: tetratricopeptide repeat protein [Alphaproteobacteria bacterium]